MRCIGWLTVLCVASTLAHAKPRKKKKPVAIEVEVEEVTPVESDEVTEVVVREHTKPAKTAGELYVRAGIAHVEPRIASGGMTLEPSGLAQLAAPMGPVQGGIETESSNIFAAIIGYAPGVFRGYLAVETIVGVPKKAKLKAKGDLANKSLAPTALGLVPTGIPPLGEELGEATAVPPMITVVARSPKLGPARVYVGAGASVLFVKDAKVTNKVLTEVATPKLEIDPAFGFVAQAGIDVQIYKRFYARLDVKEMWFAKSESRITNIHVRTQIPFLETVDVGSARSQVQANPIIVQFGLGASF